MSRILIAWELGGNLGHLAPTLPLAEELRSAGHDVSFATKNTRTAAEVLGPDSFSFFQSPACVARKRLLRPPANYAEVLAAEGWNDGTSLLGHLKAWVDLIELGRFDMVVAQHAPGALIAAGIVGCHAVAFGNGFEIPPDAVPMPTIRPWESHPAEALLASERAMLAGINAVVAALGGRPYARLGSIFPRNPILATFPELDHYGARENARYVGSVHGLRNAPEVDWPEGDGPRVAVYLRRQHRATEAVMRELATLGARAVCVIPDAGNDFKRRFATGSIAVHERPIALGPLLANADAMVGYASIGTLAEALLEGVPVAMIPTTVEQYLVARRVEQAGAGIHATADAHFEKVRSAIGDVLRDEKYRAGAKAFARTYADIAAEQAARVAAGLIGHESSFTCGSVP
jgi:UDP:flavonoid glycosyltransferase YjiC (YdhE family)